MSATSQEGVWYIIDRAGCQCGPFAAQQLVTLYSAHAIDENTLVIQQGMSQWMQYRDVMSSQVTLTSQKKLYNISTLLLAILPWILFFISATHFGRMPEGYLGIEFGISILLIVGDIFEIKQAGYELGPWVIAAIVPVLYIFIRASKTDKKYRYAIAHTIAWVIRIAYIFFYFLLGFWILF